MRTGKMEVGERQVTLLAGKVCKISFNSNRTNINSYKVTHTHARAHTHTHALTHTHTIAQQFSALAPMVTLTENTCV